MLPVQPVASAAAVRHSPDDTARQASANARAAEAARASPGAGLHLLCGEQTVDGGQARILQGPCQRAVDLLLRRLRAVAAA